MSVDVSASVHLDPDDVREATVSVSHLGGVSVVFRLPTEVTGLSISCRDAVAFAAGLHRLADRITERVS